MSHHLSGPNLRPPRGDARLDLTDTFAFTNGDNTILIMNVNPYAPILADAFHPEAVYQVNVDTTGDDVADRVYSLTFSPLTERTQTYSVWMADAAPTSPGSYGSEIVTGAQAGTDGSVQPTAVDGLTVWAGLRSDPFFADLEGILNDFKWTGRDAMGNCNVFSIVLEIPTNALGDTPQIGVWSRVSLVEEGNLISVDRGAHPSLTAYFNAEEVKDAYNAGSPDTDVATYLEAWTAVLAHTGHYGTEAAHQALAVVLPDVLRYDRSGPAAYPNGRTPTDDVTDARLAMVSGGAITGDGIGPHGDLLDSFPYLGEPHPAPNGPPAS